MQMDERKEEERKMKVLIIGGCGYIGRKLVKASLALNYQTYILYRPQNASSREKSQMLMVFKIMGALLLQGSFDDHESLVSALRQVDVVVCSVAGDQILQQFKLIQAIKEAGNIKRYIPSEFGMDADRMPHAIPPGNQIIIDKCVIRRAIEEANIPFTYVSGNCFAGVFLAGLAQLGTYMPPTKHVTIYGNGDKKCIWVDEEDVAMYTMMAANDRRAENKVLYVRPPANILTQMEVVNIWEKLLGKVLDKTFILSPQDWLSKMDKYPLYEQIAIAHFYQIYYCGDLDFEPEGPYGLDTNDLYPEYKYVSAEEYLRRFI
ncbi:putative oxidoreductase [Dioscorea sansibarensis]